MAVSTSRSKEVRSLVEAIEAAGGVVKRSGRAGHLKVYHGETGRFLGSVACMPNEYRNLRNTVSILRRNGLADLRWKP
ncbi:HicA-like toxin [Gordonia phage Pupper]|uniref:HicA-like toxin n=1 Tax=Gordonia phage Pupper TaxID=2571249 RepID=A0A4Y6EJM5_9CAUD|nr:HicA-like toxin [Gordonia phage Pupper]QDF18672.1 HicA-like toxin [Gordonia phage Pupper]QDF18904.1 HicA-like toxin [Gordonia phage SCentae]